MEWPRNLNESSAATDVEEYEQAYYPQVAFEFEPASRFSRVRSAIARVKNVSEADEGWRVRFSGILGIEEAFLTLEANPADPPDNAQIVPVDEIDDELLNGGVETVEAARRISARKTDAYIARFEELSEEFEISSPEYHDTLYFDGNGTVGELAVGVDTLHSDHEWDAWYYVNQHVLWRSGDPDVNPREGELLECRTAD